MISKRILTAELRGMRAGRHGRASVSHPRGRLRRGADPWLGHPALARQERAGPLQPTPRIAPVVGVFRNPGHRKWMQRLQQQCPQPADKHQASVCTRRIGRSRRTSGGPVSRGCEPDWSAPPARQPCRTGCDPGAPAPCARLRRRSPGSGLLSTANWTSPSIQSGPAPRTSWFRHFGIGSSGRPCETGKPALLEGFSPKRPSPFQDDMPSQTPA